MTTADTIIENHPAHWELAHLDAVCRVTGGPSRLRKEVPRDEAGEVPVISPDQLIGGRLVLDGALRITEEEAQRFSAHRIRPDDLIMTRKGERRRHALAGAEHGGALVDGSCIRIRPGDQVMGEYLYRYLAHPAVQEWLDIRVRRGLVANTLRHRLGALPVLVPPLGEQREMTALFRMLDEKISIHEQIASTTRALRNQLIQPLLAVGLNATAGRAASDDRG